MPLKVFDFSFFEKLFDLLGTLLQSAWEIFLLVVVFAFIWGCACLPVLIIYVLVVLISKYLFKKEIDFFKYMPIVTVIGFIGTILLIIYVL